MRSIKIMQTGLIIITAGLLCLTAFMPSGLTSDVNDSTAIAYWPDEGGAYPQDAHATGAITYNTGSDGSGSEPGSVSYTHLRAHET